MRDEILRLIRSSGDAFLSGEEISRRLGVTRAAIWKHVKALQEEGVDIEAVTRKGYRLKGREGMRLRAALIEPYLTTKMLGRSAVFMQSAPSSNLAARALAQQGAKDGTIVVVEEQTAGRGRMGRGWTNAPGKDICVSAILRPVIETWQAPRFTLATALGVYRLAASLGLAPSIKWPNDVLIAGKKLCGILLELQGTMEQLEFLVVGFGVNVNTQVFASDIQASAASLMRAGEQPLERGRVLASLLNELEPLFEACASERAYPDVLEAYRAACGTIGQQISVRGVSAALTGVAQGVDEQGRLLLRLPNGQQQAVSAGDVTLRPQSEQG